MFIVPFTHRTVQLNHITVHLFTILTVGGKELWCEDESLSLIDDILTPNGIFLADRPYHYKDAYLCQVDIKKTVLEDFYKWEEVTDKDTFCWRSFYTFGQGSEYTSWLPLPEQEKLSSYSYTELFEHMIQSIART